MNIDAVDVIIPAYNADAYIGQAIVSVIQQTYAHIHRIYVIDDGSTDTTKEKVLELSKKYPQITYHNQKNLGLSSARNAGLKLSKAPFIALLDADDVWLPQKLSKQMRCFRSSKFKHLGLVYCDYVSIDSGGNILTDYPSFTLDTRVRGNVLEHVLEKNCIAGSGSTVVIKRECFKQNSVFDTQLTAAEDWDMWIRIAVNYEVDFVDQPLAQLRRHPRSMQKDQINMFRNHMLLAKKILCNYHFGLSAYFLYRLRREFMKMLFISPYPTWNIFQSLPENLKRKIWPNYIMPFRIIWSLIRQP